MKITRPRRAVAMFLLLNMLNYIFLPGIAHALTSGPTAPEYSSFEPVDTTDMVSTATGDFTYNIPLIEVPGPEGSYPLSLSYHAGIMPDEEASWVGLGWTLNAGAINRTVSGYPDDHKGAQRTVTDTWEGGERSTFSVGVGLPAGPTIGLDFAEDTYQGFGMGGSINMDLGRIGGENSPIRVGASMGVGPYGGAYGSLGLSAGMPLGKGEDQAYSLGTSVGLGFSSEGASGFGSVGISASGKNKKNVPYSQSLLGASISTNGMRGSASVMGGSINQANSDAGKITTESSGFGLPVPIGTSGLFLNLGYRYTRYYSDETSQVDTYGALYPIGADSSGTFSYDSHALFDKGAAIEIAENFYANDPVLRALTYERRSQQVDKELGGSMAFYDRFQVLGQGIGGDISPYAYMDYGLNLFKQDLVGEGENYVKYKTMRQPYPRLSFRFKNDFSNHYYYGAYPSISVNTANNADLDIVSSTYDGDGYSDTRKYLAGSKHIEYFTNEEVRTGTAEQQGLMAYYDHGLHPTSFSSDTISQQIGGFMITNESGVTYHYSLPVYAHGEGYYSSTIDDSQGGKVENYGEHPHPYAYTWLLTGITGPDFVDSGDDMGRIDDKDIGYWIKFDYEKHLDDYKWRSPGTGMHKDLDENFQNYSYGKKQLYYLESIRTRTHTAFFVTSERFDGREVESLIGGGFEPVPPDLIPDYLIDDNSRTREEEYELRALKNILSSQEYQDFISNLPSGAYPRPLKKLDEVRLLKNEDFDVGNTAVTDAIRTIQMGYDYALAKGTKNSYDQLSPNTLEGKLTLQYLETLGTDSVSLIPRTNFDYGETYERNGMIVTNPENNPGYNADNHDHWGFYKSDYQDTGNENLDHMTTIESAKYVDAWSLRNIQTPTGAIINIDYESDAYEAPVLLKAFPLSIKSMTADPQVPNSVELTFHGGYPIDQLMSLGSKLDMVSLFTYPIVYSSIPVKSYLEYVKSIEDIQINSIGTNSLKINNQEIYELLITDRTGESNNSGNTSIVKGIPDFISGNIFFTEEGSEKYGGGLRVKNITTIDPVTSECQITGYSYEKGVTSYEPNNLQKAIYNFPESGAFSNHYYKDITDRTKTFYSNILAKEIIDVLEFSKLVPAPGVIYGEVTVTESYDANEGGGAKTVPGSVTYHFQTFEREMVEKEVLQDEDISVNGTYPKRTTALRDYANRVGNLLKVVQRDASGNVMSETVNHYLHDDISNSDYRTALEGGFRNQGVVHQLFSEAREVKKVDETDPDNYITYHQAQLTIKEEYPNVMVGSTTKDHRTGITTSTENLGFDFFTGSVTKGLSTDGYGHTYLTENVPAYALESGGSKVYPDMGLKIANSANKHMLTQNAASYTYKVPDNYDVTTDSKLGLVSANVTTWSTGVPVRGGGTEQTDIWRKERSYSWRGDNENLNDDGTYKLSGFTAFDGWAHDTDPTDNGWELGSKITLYDKYSHALEAEDLNGDFAATKMDSRDALVYASVVNASYDEFAYSGAEDEVIDGKFGGDVQLLSGTSFLTQSDAHTGENALSSVSGNKAFVFNTTGLREGRTYRASVWTNSTSGNLYYRLNDGAETIPAAQVENETAVDGWYLLNIDIDIENGFTSLEVGCKAVGGNALFDDFRFHPIDAAMTSNVYDPLTGDVRFILNADNLYTEYRYDEIGRLIEVRQETFDWGSRKVSEQNYHYGRQ